MITDVLIKGRAPAAETLADRFLVQAAVLPISVQKWVLRQDCWSGFRGVGYCARAGEPPAEFYKTLWPRCNVLPFSLLVHIVLRV